MGFIEDQKRWWWGFFLACICVIYGCYVKVHWYGNQALMATRLQADDVELVVIEGRGIGGDEDSWPGWSFSGEWMEGIRSLEIESKYLQKQISDRGAKIYRVTSSMPKPFVTPKYLWVGNESGYRCPIYGVFPSLEAADKWAKSHGYKSDNEFGMEFNDSLPNNMRVELASLRITLPDWRKDTELPTEVSVFTDRYDIYEEWGEYRPTITERMEAKDVRNLSTESPPHFYNLYKALLEE